VFHLSPLGVFGNGGKNDEIKFHPTQKPLRLMLWCLSFVPNCCVVFDPFMGSGSTGAACVETGRRFIGIEKEPKYFEIALKRIRDAERLAKCDLFKDSAPAKRQGVLV
jgi:site-specific DNA-methyltransferase (adenine-specific)/modification methylase